jgi:hypothetical protein
MDGIEHRRLLDAMAPCRVNDPGVFVRVDDRYAGATPLHYLGKTVERESVRSFLRR